MSNRPDLDSVRDAIEYLVLYNGWRRGSDDSFEASNLNTAKIGQSIDLLISYSRECLNDEMLLNEYDKKTDSEIKAELAAKGYTEESLKASRRRLALSMSPGLKLELEEIRAVIGDLKEALAKDQFDNARLDTLSLNSKINKLL
jgi:hypothetical protein